MNFNLDNTIGDLAADNSAEDDFFFEKSLHIKSQDKNFKMDDFSIKDDLKPRTPFTKFNANTISNKPATSTPVFKQYNAKFPDDSITGIDDDDDDDLGFDPKQPKAGNKSNLLEVLFGENLEPRTATANKTVMSRQSTATTTDNSNVYSITRPKTSAGRRSSGNSALAVNTELNEKFKDKEATTTASVVSSPRSRRRGTTADWLGLSVEPLSARPQTQQSEQVDIIANKDVSDFEHAPKVKANEAEYLQGLTSKEHDAEATDSTAQGIKLIQSMNLEANNTYHVLQQQEQQISLAAQMQKQEKTLLTLYRKQESILQQQERQFQLFVQQQIQRQQKMEEFITAQQKRINNHMQLMTSQPLETDMPVFLPTADETESHLSGQTTMQHQQKQHKQQAVNNGLETVQLEIEVKRLEMEKERLEALMINTRENYEREIEMTITSYKKQLAFVEEHNTTQENRLKLEIENLKAYYEHKLEQLKQELNENVSLHERDLLSVKEEHENEIRLLRKSHRDDMELLKDEHRSMIENVRQTKLQEFAMLQDNSSYVNKLIQSTHSLDNLNGNIQDLRDQLLQKGEHDQLEREKKVEMREKELADTERRLKLMQETAETEQKHLMNLVASLELQLTTLTKESNEEKWLMRQQLASLEAERAAFEQERTHIREQLSRDEARLEQLKQQQLQETEKQLLKLQQEREQLNMELIKVEQERKLHAIITPETEKDRVEAETLYQLAQDATQKLQQEKKELRLRKRQVEQERLALIEREGSLQAKEEELEQSVQSFRLAERKSREQTLKAEGELKNLQYQQQLLQKRLQRLNEQELLLNKQQAAVAQERLNLHRQKRHINETKCVLCRLNEESQKLHANSNVRQGPDGAVANVVQLSESPNSYAQNSMTMGGYQGDIVDAILDHSVTQVLENYNTFPNMHL